MTLRTVRGFGAVCVAAAVVCGFASVEGQGRTRERRPSPRETPAHRPATYRPAVRGQVVFVGGYFYDPFFGPYPWWGGGVYRYPYFPVLDRRAIVRLQVTPRDAAVYVDGFYAGIVDDFDGVFQGLPLPPGGHTIDIYLDGYRNVRRALYLAPGSSLKLREQLARLAPAERSEGPLVAPPLPAPPVGTYRGPVTAQRLPPPPPQKEPAANEVGYESLQVTVQPAMAVVQIDGVPWLSSDGVHFDLQMVAGKHRVEVSAPGFKRFAADVAVTPGEAARLNVSLAKG